MNSKKLRWLVYIISFIFIFNLILPLYSHAISEDSIYVWSNNSSSVSTSNNISEENSNKNGEKNSR